MTLDITEKQFEAQVKDLAKVFHWNYYHTWRSIHSPAGFPDCVMVRPPRLIFAELKSEKGQVSPKQQEWLDVLNACRIAVADHIEADTGHKLFGMNVLQAAIVNPEVYLWRPSQFEEIAEILR